MSARYLQSLRFNVQQCDYCLNVLNERAIHLNDIGVDDEECLDAIDFLMDLKNGWQRERADVSVQMARQEARVV